MIKKTFVIVFTLVLIATIVYIAFNLGYVKGFIRRAYVHGNFTNTCISVLNHTMDGEYCHLNYVPNKIGYINYVECDWGKFKITTNGKEKFVDKVVTKFLGCKVVNEVQE